tara:strand:+ start:486 stop:1490 length:1005 start_codon:yes stop_codon:yes gene_type:complete
MALNYGSLTALTRDKFLPVLVDNIFNSNVLTFKLLKNAEKLDGGKKIITPLEYGKNGAQGFYAGYDVLDTTPSDPITAAEWNWKQAYATITISGEEELKNSGDSQVLSLLKSKMKNAEKSLKDLFGDKVFNTGAVGSNEITSIAYSTATDGTEDNHVIGADRTLGGIDSATYTWWDAVEHDGSGITSWDNAVAVTSGQSAIVKAMTKAYGACTIDNDSPDMIVTNQILYDAYESALQPNKRFEGDAKLVDAGFQALRFKGANVVVDSHVPAGHMYFLNTKYLDFKVHSKRNFSFEAFQKPVNQDAQVAKIFWMGQLTCTNSRMQGVIYGLPTAY